MKKVLLALFLGTFLYGWDYESFEEEFEAREKAFALCENGQLAACKEYAKISTKSPFIGYYEGVQSADKAKFGTQNIRHLGLRGYQKLCDTGDLESCQEYGRSELEADLDYYDIKIAMENLKKACDGGLLGSCEMLGDMTINAQNYGETPNRELAKEIYKNACQKDHAQSCLKFADLKLKDNNCDEGFALINKLCDGDFKEACYYLATFYENGASAVNFACKSDDYQKAYEIHKSICDKDEFDQSCMTLARYHQEGIVAPKDEKKSIEIYERFCKNGDLFACDSIAKASDDPYQKLHFTAIVKEQNDEYYNDMDGLLQDPKLWEDAQIEAFSNELQNRLKSGKTEEAQTLAKELCIVYSVIGCNLVDK